MAMRDLGASAFSMWYYFASMNENLKNWVERFRVLLATQKQERLFGNLIGRLLAYSPIGEDGYSPCEAVRKIIEEYYSDSLKTCMMNIARR